MKKILLVDPLSDGHHTGYISQIAFVLLRTGYSVVCYHPDSDKIRQWLENKNISVKDFYSLKFDETFLFSNEKKSFVRRYENNFKKWFVLKRLIRDYNEKYCKKIDAIFFTYVDCYFITGIPPWLIDIIFPFKWICLCFRPPHDDKISIVKRMFYNTYDIFLAKNCKAVGLLEEILVFRKGNKLPFRDKMQLFPDFAETEFSDRYELVDQIREKAGGKYIIATLGSLCKRKGILPLIKSAIELRNEQCFFVFAGTFEEYTFTENEVLFVKEFIASSPVNSFFYLSFIPEEKQFNSIVELCDILTVLYENFPYSSNIFSKAAEFRKVIIGSRQNIIGERIRMYNFGVDVDCDNIEMICTAIRFLIKKYDEIKAAVKFEEYLTLHGKKNVEGALNRMLEKVF